MTAPADFPSGATGHQCSGCGLPAGLARVESAHYTSTGIVRYLQCPCGARSVDTGTGADATRR
ncbi:hypothetical protein [Nocardiopsis coralliicola]